MTEKTHTPPIIRDAKKAAVVFFALILFLFTISSSVHSAPITDGYRMDFSELQSSSYQFADNSGMNTITQGKFIVNPSYPVYDTTFTLTNVIGSPVAAELSANDSNIYMATLDTNAQLKVWAWNSTINNFQNMATAITDTAMVGLTNPIIVKFSDKPMPYVVVANNSRVVYFSFNGTALKKECQSSIGTVTGSGSLVFDYDKGLVIQWNSPNYIRAYNSDCTNMSATSTISGLTYSFRAPQSTGAPYTHSARAIITNLHGDGNHQIVIPTHLDPGALGGMDVLTYGADGHFTMDSLFDGDDIFASDYTCNNGECISISDSIKLANPIYDSVTNRIIIAAENSNAWSNCGSYCIWSIGSEGTSVWNTQDSYLWEQCGSGGAIRNVTYFQPVLMDVKTSSWSQYEYGGVGISAVCGACQKQCTATDTTSCKYINVGCYDIADGEELLATRFYIGANLYQAETANRFAIYPPLYAADFDSSDIYQELFVYSDLLNDDFSYPTDYSFGSTPYSDTKKTAFPVYFAGKEYDTDFYINPIFMLINNQSNRVYYTNRRSYLPDYVASTYITAPSNDKPLCLNFTRDFGLRVQYWAEDPEDDMMYAEHYCDLNTIGGFYYNWTNWTAIGQGGQKYQEFYCRYNQTGAITLHTRITDELHLYNYTPLSYNSKTKVYNIVDSYYPYCYSDWTIYDIDNPPSVDEETDDELIAAAGLTKNQTVSGSFQQTLTELNIITTTDKFLIAMLLIFILTVLFVVGGAFALAKLNVQFHPAMLSGIVIIDFLLFILFTLLGMIPIWFMIFLSIIIAIIGGALALKIFGQTAQGG